MEDPKKYHDQLVGLPELKSVKLIQSLIQMELSEELKFAIGKVQGTTVTRTGTKYGAGQTLTQ